MSRGMILTTAGRNLLAKAFTGKVLTFTKAQCGNGKIGTRDPLTLTNLISPKRDLPIQSMQTSSSGTVEIVVEMTNKNLTTGFFVYEYGLFAKDPDTNKEVLYSYSYTDNVSYLEGDNGIDIIRYTLSLVTVIDQASNITATITSSNNYVTVTRLDARIEELFAPYAEITGFWTFSRNDNARRFRPATLNQIRESIIGSNDISAMTSRLERLEDALSQTLLELELQNIFPGYSHFIIEDFKVVNQIDQYRARVTSAVAGDDSIDCEPLEGMIPGSSYTLSDGIKSEVVKAESINLENGIQRVILTKPITNTYRLPNLQLYRTSAVINDSIALGPQTLKSVSWTPSLVWKGKAESAEYELNVDTGANNMKAYIMTGDITFDSDSYITLGD